MESATVTSRYGTVSQVFHWVMAIVIIAALALIEMKGMYPKDTPERNAIKMIHVQLGLAAFLMIWLRLAWRSRHPEPQGLPVHSVWEARAAAWGHWALYGFMVLVPLLGIAMAQAGGKHVAFLGLPLPVLIAENKPLAGALHEVHEVLGNLFIALIALHVAAAGWHQLIRRDNGLRRMLPRWIA